MIKQYKMMEWTDEKIKKFWDYESQFPENYFTYQVGKSVIDRLHKYFSHAQNALDYGAGAGFLIPHLMKKGIVVSALDFSPDSLVAINKKFDGNNYFSGAFTLEELLSSEKRFDLIMVIEVIEHLNNDYLIKLMDNIIHLLAKNGVAIFTTPNDEDLSKSMVYCPESYVVFHRWQHVRSWSEKSLHVFVSQNGFEIIDIFTTNFSLPAKRWSLLTGIRTVIKGLLSKSEKQEKLPHLVAIIKRAGES